nr:retrovirus-related Pol polyprotein from transposon TNT 1-94 [Tanacetum cinerariifolium]
MLDHQAKYMMKAQVHVSKSSTISDIQALPQRKLHCFIDADHPSHIYKLKKALYGLKQEPRAWYDELSTFLLQNHFIKGTIDPTLFIRRFHDDILVVQVYVDDIIFGSTHPRYTQLFSNLMKSRFEMSMMGEMTFFLGLQVNQSPCGIFINQSKYVFEMLKKYGMESCDPVGTPMEIKDKLDLDQNGTLAKPIEKHLKEVKRIFRYLRGTVNTGLWYTKDSGFELTGFSDADYVGCKDSFKTTSDGAQFLGEKLVSWSSKKQDCTSLSTAKAEYVSLSACCAQVLWMRTQLTDYSKIPIYCDSKLAIAISCNPIQHSRTKHITFRYHFIKEHVKKGTIELYFVKTDYQLADIFTKVLPADRFNYLVCPLGELFGISGKHNVSQLIFQDMLFDFYQIVLWIFMAIHQRPTNCGFSWSYKAVKVRVDTSDDTMMDDESNQGRMIAKIDKDDVVVLMDDKDEDKKVEEATVVENAQGETKPDKVQEVVDVVTTAKLITKFVTAASAIIPTAEPQVPAATLSTAPARVAAALSRRRKGMVIRDPEEKSTTSTIIPETKSKDKGKGILVEEPKPLRKKQQIKIDEKYDRKFHAELNKDIDWDVAIDHVELKAKEDPAVKRYQAIKRKTQIEAQARKNMMMYLKNVFGFKLDYFKGISYDDIRLIFEVKYNSNMDFLLKTKEQMEEEENRALQMINETLAEKATKRRKLNEEVEDLKRHLEIVPDEDDDVYIEATPLARKVPVVDYKIIELNNKPYYKIIRADGTHQLYISFLTLLKNIDREDLEALWNLVKERFSTSKPKNFSDDFLLTTLGAMFEKPDSHVKI